MSQAMNRAANLSAGQILRIIAALAWEFWARGRVGIVLGPIAAIAFPCLVQLLMGSWLNHKEFVAMFPFFWITALSLGSALFLTLANSRLRYTLPAPSWLLVAGPMACVMLTMFLQYAVVATTLNAWFHADWPIVGPGLLAAVMIAWCQAVVWSTSNSLGLPFLICLTSFLAFIFATAGRIASNGVIITEFPSEVGVWHLFAFALATLVCASIGTVGFASLRRGTGLDGKRILDWLSERVRFRPAAAAAPFASADSAQFWLEWTRRGYVLPLGTTVIAAWAILLALSLPAHVITNSITSGSDFFGSVLAFWPMPLFVVSIFWGNRSPNFEFGPFAASRPLSDRQIASAVLKSATLGLISSAAIWAVGMTLVFWIVVIRRETPMRVPVPGHNAGFRGLPGGTVLAAMAIWSFVGLGTSLSLAGRKVLGIAMALAFAVWMAAVVVPMFLQDDRSHAEFTGLYFIICLIHCLYGCAFAFIATWRRHLISVLTLWLAGAMVLFAVAVLYSFGGGHGRWYEWLIVLGCFCLLPIPLAAAPLAVYVNRHR